MRAGSTIALAMVLTVAAMTIPVTVHAAQVAPMRILYVGNDPQTATLNENEKLGPFSERLLELKKARMPAFERFLRQYFKTVKVVSAPDYREPMSADYDVTIFDATPRPIKERVFEQDPVTGEVTRYEPAQYLTAKFSGAAILISDVSPRIAEPLEYKMDWQCLCLDSHAHGLKLDHPAFNTPYRVKPTLEYRPTPKDYRDHYSGRNLPDSLPMWRVQQEGYSDGKGFPPGLVSTGEGFTDAGDAEIISSGVNTKTVESVALARHGNLFHWGFSADPSQMTEEARLVFVNAVHYIAKYKGQHPYSRRRYRTPTREIALDVAFMLQRSSYEHWEQQQRANHDSRQRYFRRLQQAGQKLSPANLKAMNEPMPALPDREDWLKQEAVRLQPASLVARFGSHLDMYLPYYEQNLEYLWPGSRPPTFEDRFIFEVDEDVRSLMVSNRSVQLLELCVAMLESKLDVEKARRILTRYTGQPFASAEEWRQWLERNRSRLYFSDLDGFKFHIAP